MNKNGMEWNSDGKNEGRFINTSLNGAVLEGYKYFMLCDLIISYSNIKLYVTIAFEPNIVRNRD